MTRPERSHIPPARLAPKAGLNLNAWLLAIAIGLSLTVLLPLVAASQALPPSTDFERGEKEDQIKLKGEARALARSYVYVLDQLEETIDDYTGYFQRTPGNTHAKVLIRMLAKARAKLDEGIYHVDVDRLTEDLQKMSDQAEKIADRLMEEMIGKRPTNEQRKLVKQAHHLHQDLLILQEQLEYEVIDEAEDGADLKLVSAYFVDSLSEVVAHAVSIGLLGTIEGIKAAKKASKLSKDEQAEMWESWADSLAKALENLDVDASINWEETQKLIKEVPAPPAVVFPQGKDYTSISRGKGEVTFTIPESRRVLVRRPGEVGMIKVFSDSTETIPGGLPIQVENPVGQVTVIGWPKDFAVVHAEVEVAAKTESEAKGLTEKVELQLNQGSEGLVVEIILPSLSDPSKRVVSCNMRLKTPHGNPVSASSSFGDIHVSQMNAPVTILGSNSRVTANDIAAELTVATEVSDLSLTDISGTLDVTNSLGTIEVSDIVGDMSISNTTGTITVVDSRGEVRIGNTGPIEVRDHIGSVQIDNSNGPIEVSHLRGDLNAQNAYRPLHVESVTGSTTVRNVNAIISARELGGSFTATNNQGAIDALDLFGPVNLTNTKGPITVALRNADYSGSVISSTSGIIELFISDDANLTVNAQAIGGRIQSPLPVELSKVGGTQTGTLQVGGGGATVSVSGTNSTIIINRRQ